MAAGSRHDVDGELIIDANGVVAFPLKNVWFGRERLRRAVRQPRERLDPARRVLRRGVDEQSDVFREPVLAVSRDRVPAD